MGHGVFRVEGRIQRGLGCGTAAESIGAVLLVLHVLVMIQDANLIGKREPHVGATRLVHGIHVRQGRSGRASVEQARASNHDRETAEALRSRDLPAGSHTMCLFPLGTHLSCKD